MRSPKAIVLNPEKPTPHMNLGVAYEAKGDLDSAIREYREAKRVEPSNSDARQDLASALMKNNMNAQAVVELRELEAMSPDSAVCHVLPRRIRAWK